MKINKRIVIIVILCVVLLFIVLLIVNKTININNTANKDKINTIKDLDNTKWVSTKVILYKEGKEGIENTSDLVKLDFKTNTVQICFIDNTSSCINVEYFKKENILTFKDNDLLKLKNNYFAFEDNDLLLKGDIEDELKVKYYFEEVK